MMFNGIPSMATLPTLVQQSPRIIPLAPDCKAIIPIVHRRMKKPSLFKRIWRFILAMLHIQNQNQAFHKCPPPEDGIPAPGINLTLDGGTFNASITLSINAVRGDNHLELWRASDPAFSTGVKVQDQVVSPFLLAFSEHVPNNTTYYYRARERNAGSTVFSPWSVVKSAAGQIVIDG